jgi:hypothetical protein
LFSFGLKKIDFFFSIIIMNFVVAELMISSLLLFVERLFLRLCAKWVMFWNPDDYLVMDFDSTVEDVISCIEASDNKLEKRIKRLEMLVMYGVLNGCLSDNTLAKARYVIKTKKISKESNNKSTTKPDVFVNDLFAKSSDVFEGQGLFEGPKNDVKKVFNSFAKDVVNESGEVYDIMTYLVVIAFNQFKKLKFYGLNEELKKDAHLIFKGGASIGKFLIKNYSSDAEKKLFFDTFVRCGDNDTSIKFGDVKGYEQYDIYKAQEFLTEQFNVCLLDCFNKYDIERVIKHWTDLVVGRAKEELDMLFMFADGKCKSFKIVDYAKVDQQEFKRIVTTNTVESSIYSTISTLDFVAGGVRNSFFLTRLKKAYVLMSYKGNECIVNSELLDVSVVSPFSTDRNTKYIVAKI